VGQDGFRKEIASLVCMVPSFARNHPGLRILDDFCTGFGPAMNNLVHLGRAPRCFVLHFS
jgi:hypothetical protein